MLEYKKTKLVSGVTWERIGSVITVNVVTKIPGVGSVVSFTQIFNVSDKPYAGQSVGRYKPNTRGYRLPKKK